MIETGDRSTVSGCAPVMSVDADQFEAIAQAPGPPGCAARASAGARRRVWGGEPLPEERYSDWALGWRERLSDLHVAVLAALTDECLGHGDLGGERYARELLEVDPSMRAPIAG